MTPNPKGEPEETSYDVEGITLKELKEQLSQLQKEKPNDNQRRI